MKQLTRTRSWNPIDEPVIKSGDGEGRTSITYQGHVKSNEIHRHLCNKDHPNIRQVDCSSCSCFSYTVSKHKSHELVKLKRKKSEGNARIMC